MESRFASQTFAVALTNLDVSLETVQGVTYPHHIFGPGVALQNERGELLLPGVKGEVRLAEGQRYTLETLDLK